MEDMKSAYERAMEKVEKMGKASAEEMARMDAVPAGNRLAARFMKEPDLNLDAELANYKGTEVRKQVVEGAMEILLRHMCLPVNEVSKAGIPRAKQGILMMKENKKAVEAMFTQVDTLFNYYEQARQQAFDQVKQSFERAMGQQMRGMGQIGTQPNTDVTAQPQFREEWSKALAGLNRQYEQALHEAKQQLLSIP